MALKYQPPILWYDSIGARYISANLIFYAHTKYVEIDFHFIENMVAKKLIEFEFLSTKD